MVNLQGIVEHLNEQFYLSENRAYPKVDSDEILVFPRKRLKMQKLRSGNWEPQSWFIRERLNRMGVKLEQPTDVTHEGLTSGYRSAIVKAKDGRYLKLKGVCPSSPFIKKQSGWGLNDFNESFYDQIGNHVFSYDTGYGSGRPAFIEPFVSPFTDITLCEFRDIMRSNPRGIRLDSPKLIQKLRYYHKIIGECAPTTAVSALEIMGDTRLDEMIYHLTPLKLSGDQKKVRDELLIAACFWSGASKAGITLADFTWSANMDHTNTHIGNFVVCNCEGRMGMRLTDFVGFTSSSEFESRGSYCKVLKEEIDSFRDDLFMDTTISPASQPKYKNFPKKLRQDCFDAIRTGYYAILQNSNNKRKSLWGVEKDIRLVYPQKPFIAYSEMKDQINFILSRAS